MHFQAETKAKRGKPYDKANLLRAFEATKTGMSVYRASRLYSVPESTLRDRTRGYVSLDGRSGPERLFSHEEEKQLTQHITYMGDIGYGYSKGSIQYMAADFAKSIGRPVKAANGLSDHWFYGLLKRWPELKMVKPQKLHIARAKSASKEIIDKYFKELGTILRENDLMDAPERIFNIDETGISTEHSPPRIVCSKATDPQAVTSPKSSNVTIIAGANALGNHIPPFYVFPGKRWVDELLSGAPAGSAGTMSDSGWSNSSIFETYVMDHFAKHAGVKEGLDQKPSLILYDGHKSHLLLTLTQWASERRVILFVLPPHTSHLTQPLDVGVFGPLKSHYYKECQTYLQQNPGISITRYEVAKLTARPYLKALCPENILSGFRRCGIYLFYRKGFSSAQLAPAVIYKNAEKEVVEESEPAATDVPNAPGNQTESAVSSTPTEVASIPPANNTTARSAMQIDTDKLVRSADDKINEFFSSKKITTVVQRPKKKFVPPYSVTGNLMKKSNLEHLNKQASSSLKTAVKPKKVQVNGPYTKSKSKKIQVKGGKSKQRSPQPSTSGVAIKRGGPIDLNTPEYSSDSDESIPDEEKCCVCKLFHPQETRGCEQLLFTKWAQCDKCPHWVHLQYCTKVRVVRLGDTFICPHCSDK